MESVVLRYPSIEKIPKIASTYYSGKEINIYEKSILMTLSLRLIKVTCPLVWLFLISNLMIAGVIRH